MLKAKDFRQRAWLKLSGKWGIMALIAFIFSVLTALMGGSSAVGIGAIAEVVLGGPLFLGLVICSLNVSRGKVVEVKTMFEGFNNFVNAFVLYITNAILLFLWSLLLVIPGIIKYYSYSMSYYILADNPNMTANDARKMSMSMMKGNKWRLFCLEFSFIGWWILCIFTLGILSFWITPYMHTAIAEFYQSLVDGNSDGEKQLENNAQSTASSETTANAEG